MTAFFTRKALWAGLGVALAAIAGVLYFQGVLGAGMESYDVQSSLDGLGRNRSGWSIGPKKRYLRKGQTFEVSYDVQIKKGHLSIHLLKSWAKLGEGTVERQVVRTSGSGVFRAHVPEAGLYALVIDAYGDGKGFDLEYTARWSSRAAR